MRLDPYDPLWPREFDAEAGRLERAFADADLPVRVEHVGSTAVVSLVARPVIDILLGVPAKSPRQPYNAVLRQLGYEPTANDGVRGRARYRRGRPISHVVDVAGWSGRYWHDELLFRDYLREHPEAAREFGGVKRQLAGAVDDSHEYADEKSRFIRRVLQVARRPR